MDEEKEMKTFGIIMAGGGGERFWPLSRRERPKQLLNLSGKEVMVNEAIDRLTHVCARADIRVVTNAHQLKAMRSAISKRLKEEQILAEPAARNTVACIGYAAMEIVKKNGGDGIMVITPSDAYIKDTETFSKVLQTAIDTAEKKNCLVTVGITPTFPATGYGYIHFRKEGGPAKQVLRFVEKPPLKRAKRYVASEDYVWNSGMFIWKASVILEKYKKFIPDVYELLCRIGDAMNTPEEKTVLEELYPLIRSVSIDYAIMEKSKDIFVLPSEFGWSDVGSWDMLSKLYGEDANGNVVVSDFIGEDTHNSVIYAKKKFVATVGLKNVIIVDTPDALLVCAKDRAQEVKKIVEDLRTQGREELL